MKYWIIIYCCHIKWKMQVMLGYKSTRSNAMRCKKSDVILPSSEYVLMSGVPTPVYLEGGGRGGNVSPWSGWCVTLGTLAVIMSSANVLPSAGLQQQHNTTPAIVHTVIIIHPITLTPATLLHTSACRPSSPACSSACFCMCMSSSAALWDCTLQYSTNNSFFGKSENA